MIVLKLIKNVICEKISHKGTGVGKVWEGKKEKKIFVEHLLPGENADIKIDKRTSKYLVGTIETLNTTAKERITPLCPYAHICGGCDLQHVAYVKQRNMKRDIVVADMVRELGTECKYNKEVKESPQVYGYRNKAQIPIISKSDGTIAAAFYQKNSHHPVFIDWCYIQHDIMNEVMVAFVQLAMREKLVAYDEKTHQGDIRHLYLRYAEATDEVMVTIVTKTKQVAKLADVVSQLVKKFPQIKSVIQNIQPEKTNIILGKTEYLLYGKQEIRDELLGLQFSMTSQSFYQVNRQQTEKLYTKALELAELQKTDTVYDFYCGIGTLTLLAAQKVKKALGIEIVADAIRIARENARQNQLANVEFHATDVFVYMQQLEAQGIQDIVAFVDPPRKGCGELFLQELQRLHPKKIVYISCNPKTLARDANVLKEQGYEMGEVTFFDMFPQTMHLEAVVVFTRKRECQKMEGKE